MRKWNVVVEIYRDGGMELKKIVVEAGNKKMAFSRALIELNKDERYRELYKKVRSVEEEGAA